MSHASEKNLIEEKAAIVSELKRVSDALQIERDRNENVERVNFNQLRLLKPRSPRNKKII